jgi:hypothetical protein
MKTQEEIIARIERIGENHNGNKTLLSSPIGLTHGQISEIHVEQKTLASEISTLMWVLNYDVSPDEVLTQCSEMLYEWVKLLKNKGT